MFIRSLPAPQGVDPSHATGRIFFVRNCTFIFSEKIFFFRKFFFFKKILIFQKKKCRFFFSVHASIFFRNFHAHRRPDGPPDFWPKYTTCGQLCMCHWGRRTSACVTGADGPPPHTQCVKIKNPHSGATQ